jgi:hypothetical protein
MRIKVNSAFFIMGHFATISEFNTSQNKTLSQKEYKNEDPEADCCMAFF